MPIHVLHIEDNPGDALLLRAILDASSPGGFTLTHADRLATGLETLGSATFDVILLDMSLPDSFGIDTFRRVREKAPLIPVIVLSGLDDEAAAMQTVQAGAQDYLCKDELNERMLARSIRYAIERHHADERFEAERSLLRSVIDSLPDQIYVKDCESKFIACNTAVAQIMGMASPDAIVGKTDFDLFPLSLAEKFHTEEIAVFSGQPRVNREERSDSAAGQARWMLTTKVPLKNKDGVIFGMVGINRDITERKYGEDRLVKLLADLKKSHEDLKAAQLQLIQAEKMESVGRIAAGVAHEVKNPLAVAVMGLDYLKNTLGSTNPAAAPVLNDIYDAIKRADTVIGGLLDFSRPRTLILKPEVLNEVIGQTVALIRHDVSKKQIVMEQNLADGLPDVMLDCNKMKQVLLNLFMNALHATPKSGTLIVSTYSTLGRLVRDDGAVFPAEKFGPEDAVICIRIEDSGTGISDENLNKIFDPYFTTKPVGEGTGLGLPVSRQIVELHGGVLDIRNRRDGKGARAVIVLRHLNAASGSKRLEKSEP
ncbi:MAG: ATP-binding protein [Planctomycetota bacterium]